MDVGYPGMDDPIHAEGLFFFPHVLRRLSDELVQASETVYPRLGITAPPRTASTLHLLHRRGPQSVTEIASAIRQSHPLVITWIRQLKALDLIETRSDPDDGRRTMVALTPAGRAQVERMLAARPVLEAAYRRLMRDADADIFDALWRIEAALRERSFESRVADQA